MASASSSSSTTTTTSSASSPTPWPEESSARRLGLCSPLGSLRSLGGRLSRQDVAALRERFPADLGAGPAGGDDGGRCCWGDPGSNGGGGGSWSGEEALLALARAGRLGEGEPRALRRILRAANRLDLAHRAAGGSYGASAQVYLEQAEAREEEPVTPLPPSRNLRAGVRVRRRTSRFPRMQMHGRAGREAADGTEKRTCDIRLRVRAEYCHHDAALQESVFSNKPDPLERQLERFSQAVATLKSRDLGAIICDIKFSALTYLDAFWRDYLNGSLLEALKGVFITDSLKQAVGHEAIRLLVNVDEDDYEAGRRRLLGNASPSAAAAAGEAAAAPAAAGAAGL
ncbi:death effector domain-containing protein-like [Petromyzon marinus]|uniref:death effector domain-containing protein-like n=1 Tax=Petromyzon marinus TaxID=7757 RepID=UPI003F6E7503